MVEGKKRVLFMRSYHHGQYRLGQGNDELTQRRGGFGAPFMCLGRQRLRSELVCYALMGVSSLHLEVNAH